MDSLRESENKIYFRLHDFECRPEEITGILQIDPTRTWSKGDFIGHGKGDLKRKESAWELQSSLPEANSVEEHVEFILDVLYSKFDDLKSLIDKYLGELSVVMYLYDEFNPGVNFSNGVLKKITDLGLELDFDIYFIGDR